jgi:hypothetical protein
VLGPWSLAAFAGAAGGVRLHYIVLLPPLEQCLDRVSKRLGHGFTDLTAAEHMYRQFEDAPLDRRHVVTDLPDDAGASAARLRELVDTASLVIETPSGPVSR